MLQIFFSDIVLPQSAAYSRVSTEVYVVSSSISMVDPHLPSSTAVDYVPPDGGTLHNGVVDDVVTPSIAMM